MYALIDLYDENQAEYLNSALRRHGLDSFVLKTGISPQGAQVFSISCFNASELKTARHLIYSCQHFIGDIHPEAVATIREIRYQNNKILLRLITSKPMMALSFLAITAALVGYALGV